MTVSRALESLPSHIRIGHTNLRIVKRADGDFEKALYGEYDQRNELITMSLNQTSQLRVVNTFIHEVNHAIFDSVGLTDDCDEERTVTAMSNGLVQAFVENPWYGPWITKWTKET